MVATQFAPQRHLSVDSWDRLFSAVALEEVFLMDNADAVRPVDSESSTVMDRTDESSSETN